jgi:tetratricopeptide (TPR) repeat protein
MRTRTWIVAVATLVCSVTVARADPAAEARKHFQVGEAHYRAERFADAIAAYEAAYAQVPEPALLFNIAQAYRRDGNDAMAIDHYQRFLARTPTNSAATRAAVEHIRELGGVAPERPADPPAAPVREVAPPPQPTPSPEPVDTTPPAPGPGATLLHELRSRPAAPAPRGDEPAPSPGTRGRTLRLAGMASGAGGVLLSGTALYFGLRARSLSREVSAFEGDAWMTALDDKIRDGDAAERNAIIFGIAGGAAIATGAVLYLVGRRQGRDSSLALVAAPTGTRLVVAGVF